MHRSPLLLPGLLSLAIVSPGEPNNTGSRPRLANSTEPYLYLDGNNTERSTTIITRPPPFPHLVYTLFFFLN